MAKINPGVFKTSVNKFTSFVNRAVEPNVARPDFFGGEIKISEELPVDVFNSITALKPSIAKFVKENNLIVDFTKGKKDSRVHMQVNQNNIKVFTIDPVGADAFGMQQSYILGGIDKVADTELLVNPPKTMDSFARSVFKKLSEAVQSSINQGLAVHLK